MLVDSSMGSVTFVLIWSESSLTYTLRRPDGIEINPENAGTDRSVTFFSDNTYASYTIHAPMPGEWKLLISGTPGQTYELSVSTQDAMSLSLNIDKKNYLAGEPIKFTASIEDSISPIVLPSPEYVHGMNVQVTGNGPNRQPIESFFLLDSNDDGIYEGMFTDTSPEGFYKFKVEFSGKNNRAGEPFSREGSLSVEVNSPPSVKSVRLAPIDPVKPFYVNYEVAFSEPVRGVDVKDFALTTSSGLSGVAIDEILSSLDNITYTVIVYTGKGSGKLRLDVVDNDTISDGADPRIYGVNCLGCLKLGGEGIGNGNFRSGETYSVVNGLPAK